jgi:hypothetical protein
MVGYTSTFGRLASEYDMLLGYDGTAPLRT